MNTNTDRDQDDFVSTEEWEDNQEDEDLEYEELDFDNDFCTEGGRLDQADILLDKSLDEILQDSHNDNIQKYGLCFDPHCWCFSEVYDNSEEDVDAPGRS